MVWDNKKEKVKNKSPYTGAYPTTIHNYMDGFIIETNTVALCKISS